MNYLPLIIANVVSQNNQTKTDCSFFTSLPHIKMYFDICNVGIPSLCLIDNLCHKTSAMEIVNTSMYG